MILTAFSRKLCGVFSFFAILSALLYARGPDILINIGYVGAISVSIVGSVIVLIIGVFYLLNSDFMARSGVAFMVFCDRKWSAVVWTVRSATVAFTTLCWYAATVPNPNFGGAILTPTEMLMFVAISGLASVCVTRYFLGILPDADREQIAPFAHVFMWFAITACCLLLLLIK